MNAFAPTTLKRLLINASLYMALALIAGVVAILENLPAEFAGSSSGLPLTQDFLYGTVGVLGLALIELITFIGALSEPITLRVVNPARVDPLKAVLMAEKILLPLVIVVFGWSEWRSRQREKTID